MTSESLILGHIVTLNTVVNDCLFLVAKPLKQSWGND